MGDEKVRSVIGNFPVEPPRRIAAADVFRIADDGFTVYYEQPDGRRVVVGTLATPCPTSVIRILDANEGGDTLTAVAVADSEPQPDGTHVVTVRWPA